MYSIVKFFFFALVLCQTGTNGHPSSKKHHIEAELIQEDGKDHAVYFVRIKNVSVNVTIDLEIDKGEKVDLANITQIFEGKNCRQVSHSLKGSGSQTEYNLTYKCRSELDLDFASIILHGTLFGLILAVIMTIIILIARSCFILHDNAKEKRHRPQIQVTSPSQPSKATMKKLQESGILKQGYINRVLVIRTLEDGPPPTKNGKGKKENDDTLPAVMLL